jgi:hypothetical protein
MLYKLILPAMIKTQADCFCEKRVFAAFHIRCQNQSERFAKNGTGTGLPDVKPNIPIWVNFGGLYIGKCRFILWPFGIFYRDLGYFMAIGYILYSFGIMYQEKSGIPGQELAICFFRV